MRIDAVQAPEPSTELAEETGTALALLGNTSAALIYAPGALTALVDRLKAEVRGQLATLDVSIPKDRKRMVSLADRVASAKVKLDKMGESLIEEHRAVVTAVNADRKIMRDDLDSFKVEVRKPVTDLENADKARVAAHEYALAAIAESPEFGATETSAELRTRLEFLNAFPDRDWQEFKARADKAISDEILRTEGLLARAEKREAAIAEAKRLDDEARERAIKEREEAAAKAATEEANRRAAEQARIAQEAAERERQRVENERIEAEARAKQAEAQRIAAEERAAREAEQAEARRIAAEQEAARRAEEAAIKAKMEQERAVEAERKRIADEQKREAEEAEKRARNRAHQASVNREALAAFVALGATDEFGKAIIKAIAGGDVPHVRMEY